MTDLTVMDDGVHRRGHVSIERPTPLKFGDAFCGGGMLNLRILIFSPLVNISPLFLLIATARFDVAKFTELPAGVLLTQDTTIS